MQPLVSTKAPDKPKYKREYGLPRYSTMVDTNRNLPSCILVWSLEILPVPQHMHIFNSPQGSHIADLPVIGNEAEIGNAIERLLEAISALHTQNSEIRQLYLETHWLKSDHKQGNMTVPTDWELMVLSIARGEVSPVLRKYPQVVAAAAALGAIIKSHVVRRPEIA